MQPKQHLHAAREDGLSCTVPIHAAVNADLDNTVDIVVQVLSPEEAFTQGDSAARIPICLSEI